MSRKPGFLSTVRCMQLSQHFNQLVAKRPGDHLSELNDFLGILARATTMASSGSGLPSNDDLNNSRDCVQINNM